jgi:hypothetical protein
VAGHSHGGSVIWHALRQATVRGQVLSGLRSWSTVGTPFLKHRTRNIWHVTNMVNLVLAVILLRPALFVGRRLVHLFGAAVFGVDDSIMIAEDRAPVLVEAVRGPVLRLLSFLGVSTQQTSEGIRLGSFDPAGDQSLFSYLFFSVEGWLILGIVLLCIYVFLNLGTFFLSPLLESWQIRQETRLEQRAWKTYRGRWLGIWSGDDEAINGLRTSLLLSISFVHRMTYRESVFFSDRLLLISRPYHWIFVPFYNALVRPLLDGVVRSHLVKAALGNNRPSAEVVAVETVPGPLQSECQPPAIPDWLGRKITEAADLHASSIAPQLRTLLAEPSFASGLETFSHTITGHELVHTSYFDHCEVLALLAAHVAWARHDPIELADDSVDEPSLMDWFRDFKGQLGEVVESVERAEGSLLQPRRAA